jgi:hypothetical protein
VLPPAPPEPEPDPPPDPPPVLGGGELEAGGELELAAGGALVTGGALVAGAELEVDELGVDEWLLDVLDAAGGFGFGFGLRAGRAEAAGGADIAIDEEGTATTTGLGALEPVPPARPTSSAATNNATSSSANRPARAGAGRVTGISTSVCWTPARCRRSAC